MAHDSDGGDGFHERGVAAILDLMAPVHRPRQCSHAFHEVALPSTGVLSVQE